MKASETIKKIQELINEFGDCDIGIYNLTENEFEELDQIEARIIGKMDRKKFPGIFFGLTNFEIGDWFRQIKYQKELKEERTS